MDSIDPLLQQARQRCADGPPSVAGYAEYARLLEQAGAGQPALQNYVIATMLQAAMLSPLDAGGWLQLGLAFHQEGRDDRARSAFVAALLTRPAMAEALNNLGAVEDLRRAVRLAPNNADYHCNLAHALLAQGQFAEGFRQWEWRKASPPRDFKQPRWQGQELKNATLLVHAEQGFGDSLLFARFLPLAAKRVGRLIVETRAPMADLLGRVEGVDRIVLWGETLPDFDVQIPMPSLAAWLPSPQWTTPYLSAPRSWDLPAGRKIGVVWGINQRNQDFRRAMDFSLIAALAESRPDLQFYGLQRELPDGDSRVTQLGGQIRNFDDLAAAVMAMDTVLSVDTAAAHLAAGLGRDVRVMLPFTADWRWWGPDRSSSAFYPSAKLYRQRTPGSWHEVLEEISQEIG